MSRKYKCCILYLFADTSSNQYENSGFYGHNAARDYASISRAHCNESSAWSNPNFSNPSGNPPFGSVTSNRNTTSKSEFQKESMDLSASHDGPVTIKTAPATSSHLAVNGDAIGHNHVIPSSQANVECKREPQFHLTPAISSMTNVTVDQKPNFVGTATTNNIPCAPKAETDVSLASDNVEFALESLFHSDTSVVVPTPPTQNPKDMCVESVEKLLKSPEGSDDDDLTILYDTDTSKKNPNNSDVDAKQPLKQPPVGTNDKTDAEVLINKNCDCNVKTDAMTSIVEAEDLMSTKSIERIKCEERLNDIKLIENVENNCDAKNTDQISSEQASASSLTVANATNDIKPEPRVIGKNAGSSNAANENFAPKIAPGNSVGTEEITYVQVENELEKMFAGIEDSSDPLAPTQPQNLSTTSVDPLNNLSLNTSNTQLPQGSTNLFDSVNVPAKSSKKKTSKKSKPGGASIKSMKDKQKSSSSLKELSSSLDTMRRVPVIHIEGSKENPISAHIINSIKSEDDDVSDGRTSAKRKLGKSDPGLISIFFFKFNNPDVENKSTYVFGILGKIKLTDPFV